VGSKHAIFLVIENYQGNLTEGTVSIAPFSALVPSNVAAAVNDIQASVINGTDLVFCGPLVQGFNPDPITRCITRTQFGLIGGHFANINFHGNADLSVTAKTKLAKDCYKSIVVTLDV
jgi:hypothetical protein